MSKTMFKFELGSLAIQTGLDGFLHEWLVVRMDPRPPLVEVIGERDVVVAELVLPLRREIDHACGEVPVPDPDVRALHGHRQPCFARTQGLFRLFSFRYIHHEGGEGIGIFETQRRHG